MRKVERNCGKVERHCGKQNAVDESRKAVEETWKAIEENWAFYCIPNLSCNIYGTRRRQRRQRRCRQRCRQQRQQHRWLLNHLDVLISSQTLNFELKEDDCNCQCAAFSKEGILRLLPVASFINMLLDLE